MHPCKNAYNNLAFTYNLNFLSMHKNDLVVYCDLDCFPIAPFDNFIVKPGDEDTNWFTKLRVPEHLTTAKYLGAWSYPFGSIHTIHHDSWCICNNKGICTDIFIQIHTGAKTDENLIYHQGMVMNKKDIPQYKQRSKDFHEMKI